MAMPRYRYAIGQAPVRFPSPKLKEVDKTKQDDKCLEVNARLSRRSLVETSANVPSGHKRATLDTSRLRDSHRKTKSMYVEGNSSNVLAVPTAGQASTSTRRMSFLGVVGVEAKPSSHSLQPKTQRGPVETTPLQFQFQDMTQRQARPASTSISSSSRPSSLFWTAPQSEAVMQQSNTKDTFQKTAIKKQSYGAIEDATERNEDDPYGYRALAGPALLPSYHEQQQKQQRLKEERSRTCGPSIAMVRKRSWISAVVLGISLLGIGIVLVLV